MKAVLINESVVEKRYKAQFRWVKEQEKKIFKKSECLVPISLGQYYHENSNIKINNITAGGTLKFYSR